MEILDGKLPSSAEPEIGFNGGGSSSRLPEWVSRQNTLVSAPLLHHHTLNLICGKRSSSFDLSNTDYDTKGSRDIFYKHTSGIPHKIVTHTHAFGSNVYLKHFNLE